MQKYHGSCHCGAVTYEVEGEFNEGLKCNCSHCSRKGFILTFVPEDKFKLLSGEDNLTSYKFNKKQIDHTFCKTCGVESFAIGSDGQGNYMVAINLNCLEGFATDNIKINNFNGRDI